MSTLKLAIPSKGRLMDLTLSWFKDYGIDINMPSDSREYAAGIMGMPRIQVVLISANEIPKKLSLGQVELGITGQDLARETVPIWEENLIELKLLNFGRADLVLAVPRFWVDVESIDDFDAVATKYHNIMRSYLRRMGVADYQLIDSQGATEGAVKNNSAEAIADITSSGKTLAANHLKVVGDQPILNSQATLYLSKVANWSPNKYRTLKELTKIISIDEPQISYLSK